MPPKGHKLSTGNGGKHHDVSSHRLDQPQPANMRSPIFRPADVPLYVRVREHLRSTLLELQPGEMIPAEPVLCKRFRVSRITLRRAIDDLASENLLIRKQGRGTFRAAPKLIHELNSITSWTEQLKLLGYTPRTAERSIEEVKAPRQIAAMLQMGTNEPVTVMRRLRLANNEPITQMVNYLPSNLIPGFAEAMHNSESLYRVLADRYGLVAARATDTVTSRAATDMESERLRLEPWAPLLAVTRTAYLESGKPFEVSVAISRGDRFEYRVRLFSAQASSEAGTI